MEGSEIILSLDYAVDDELKDDGHDVCFVCLQIYQFVS